MSVCLLDEFMSFTSKQLSIQWVLFPENPALEVIPILPRYQTDTLAATIFFIL